MRRLLSLALLCFALADAPPSSYAGSLGVPTLASAPSVSDAFTPDRWKGAAKLSVAYNTRTRAVDNEATDVYVGRDASTLYVAFVVKQSATLTAQHLQNDAGLGNDDQVVVYLYPSGANGFYYVFAANPRGTHAAFSSENTSFAPTWQSAGEAIPGGYIVKMSIPLTALKGTGASEWRANFRQLTSATLDDKLWSYSPLAIAGSDPPITAAGALTGMQVAQAAARPKPRFGAYALGALNAPSIGGDTSRVGLDASIPLTQTTAFVSTIHPDFSNVEVDQQTISPTAFPRYFNDVRPFFTQLQNYYNSYNCYACTLVQPLYTTSIPTPRYGNAIEGKQGIFSFSGFDAAGVQRDDNAQTVSLLTVDQRFGAELQQNIVSMPGLVDATRLASAYYDSQKGLAGDLLASNEAGTNVTDASQGRWVQGGLNFYDKTQALSLSWQHIGSQYNPVDGYTANNDLAGTQADYNKTWYGSKDATIPRVLVFAQTDLYKNANGGVGESDDIFAVGFDFKRFLGKLAHLRLQTGSSYVRVGSGSLEPAIQNSAVFTYGYRTAVPVTVSFYTGAYGPGRLNYWSNQASALISQRITLTAEADYSNQTLAVGGAQLKQWLERGSAVWQIAPSQSVSLGARRIIGDYPIVDPLAPTLGTANAWNLSAAYYRRWPNAELYIAYGDPSQFSTVPQFIFKIIKYVGAEKGV